MFWLSGILLHEKKNFLGVEIFFTFRDEIKVAIRVRTTKMQYEAFESFSIRALLQGSLINNSFPISYKSLLTKYLKYFQHDFSK